MGVNFFSGRKISHRHYLSALFLFFPPARKEMFTLRARAIVTGKNPLSLRVLVNRCNLPQGRKVDVTRWIEAQDKLNNAKLIKYIDQRVAVLQKTQPQNSPIIVHTIPWDPMCDSERYLETLMHFTYLRGWHHIHLPDLPTSYLEKYFVSQTNFFVNPRKFMKTNK